MAYLTTAAIRTAVPALQSTADFPDTALERYGESFEGIAEDYRGVAFEPRTATDTFTLTEPTGTLRLTWPKVRSITSVTVTSPAVGGSSTVVSSSLYAVDPDAGILSYPTGFSAGDQVVVVYSHGEDAPPATLIEAYLEYVRARAMQARTNVQRDVIAQSVEGMTTRFSTPDKDAGRPTGYLDVDRMLNSLPDYRAPF